MMRLIKHIDFIDVPDDPHPLSHYPEKDVECFDLNAEPCHESFTVVRELVRGRRFVHPEMGFDIVIGYSSQVEKAIGLSFDVFEKQSDELSRSKRANESSRRAIDILTHELYTYKNALDERCDENFWQRLRRLWRP